jgi:hypothetical protein
METADDARNRMLATAVQMAELLEAAIDDLELALEEELLSPPCKASSLPCSSGSGCGS